MKEVKNTYQVLHQIFFAQYSAGHRYIMIDTEWDLAYHLEE